MGQRKIDQFIWISHRHTLKFLNLGIAIDDIRQKIDPQIFLDA